jgi:hypothetical protein
VARARKDQRRSTAASADWPNLLSLVLSLCHSQVAAARFLIEDLLGVGERTRSAERQGRAIGNV